MNILVPVAAAAAVFLIANRLYPRWIARNFGEDDRNEPPSVRFADGRDYVKSRTHVVFAHHFAAIAGAGPIIGPTMALAFGWQPVWLWVVIGGIFFGAVHDMCAMFASFREGGPTIGEIARRTLGPLGYLLYLLVLLITITAVNATFLNLSVTALTSVYPLAQLGLEPGQTLLNTHPHPETGVPLAHIGGIATTSVIVLTAFAPLLGWLIHRRHFPTGPAYLLAGAVCLGSIVLGFVLPVRLSGDVWFWVLATYCFFAATLPVWLILQPRDFANVQILYGGILLLFASVLIRGLSGATMEAPTFDIAAGQAALRGAIWPILFITVACGAISGFHSLVASGTTVKQLARESDVRRVAYGAMLLESFLAVLVVVAVASALSRPEYMDLVFPAVEGVRSNPVLAFALGVGNLMNAALPFIPVAVAVVIGILMLEGFVVTTLDASVRLARYLLEEFWRFIFLGNAPALLRSPWLNTLLVVSAMVGVAALSALPQIWPVFGAGNQIIGALALTTVTVWLVQRSRHHLFAALPAVFMIATTSFALWIQVKDNLLNPGNRLLGAMAALLLFLAAGSVAVGASRFAAAAMGHSRRPLESAAGGK